MELKSRGEQGLTSKIAVVESLIMFKRESPNLRRKKAQGNSDSDGGRDKSPRQDKPTTFKGKGKDKKDEMSKL